MSRKLIIFVFLESTIVKVKKKKKSKLYTSKTTTTTTQVIVFCYISLNQSVLASVYVYS